MVGIDEPRRALKEFFLRHKWVYLSAALSIMAAEFVTVQTPNIIGDFTDALGRHELTSALILHYAALLSGIGLLYVLLFGYGQLCNGRLGRRFEYELRRRLFEHWETLHTGYFRRRSVGDLLNHALSDVQAVRESMSMGLNQSTNAVFLLIAALIMTFRTVSVKLTLLSMIPILFVPVFVVWWGPRVRHSSRRVQEGLSDMADLTEESLSAIRLVKTTANEDVEAQRFRERVDRIVERQMGMFRQSAVFQSIIPLMGSISFTIALTYGGYLTLTHEIKLGMFVAFTLYLGLIITPLQQIGMVINTLQRASASLQRLDTLFGERAAIRDPRNPRRLEGVRGDLRVDLPAFSYPDGERPALRDVHFGVTQGQTLGIVGRSGAGKTTLVNLLPRIFDPPPGTVFLDGVDIRELTLHDLRSVLAYVPQDGFLFSTTIAENIGFSRENTARREIEQAARDASIHDDIQAFARGFDTEIGERGVTLSGGQRQRTAMARAFLKNAPILILDDSLSAVDMNTERRLIATIKELRHDKTTVIVAHRLSALRHADLIIVLDEGQVSERGTHDELLYAGGIYASIWALQEEGEGVTA